MGPNIAWILENYWKRQRIVPKVGKCLGTEFGTGRGVTQGNSTLPMIFNIVVYVVVYVVMEEVCIPQEAQHGGEKYCILYGLRKDSGAGSWVGTGYTNGDGHYVSTDGAREEPRKSQGDGMSAWVHLGEMGGDGI